MKAPGWTQIWIEPRGNLWGPGSYLVGECVLSVLCMQGLGTGQIPFVGSRLRR
jgi:hypothetical protein